MGGKAGRRNRERFIRGGFGKKYGMGERMQKKNAVFLQRFWDRACGILYPRRCPVCMQIVTPRGALVHGECREKLRYICEPACKRCGRQISRMEKEYCSECARREFRYTRGYAVWQYEANIRHSLSEFKYRSRKEFADFYAAEAVRLYGEKIRREQPEVLLPVPVHRTRRAERGFNQAQLLAEKIGRALGIPVDAHCLLRTKQTRRLKDLDRRERAKMLKDAFSLAPAGKVNYHSVMLVDDIYTTGSTVDACAAVLRHAGVEKVTVLCMAIGASIN